MARSMARQTVTKSSCPAVTVTFFVYTRQDGFGHTTQRLPRARVAVARDDAVAKVARLWSRQDKRRYAYSLVALVYTASV
jgi:hypothetical protein